MLLEIFVMIQFNNKIYASRLICIEEYGEVVVSVCSLNEALFNDSYNYICEKARLIDETIFYFVADEMINLSDMELRNLINFEIV